MWYLVSCLQIVYGKLQIVNGKLQIVYGKLQIVNGKLQFVQMEHSDDNRRLQVTTGTTKLKCVKDKHKL